MILFLSNPAVSLAHTPLSRPIAYSRVSVACDVDITQLVNLPRVGAHFLCPKVLFVHQHP